MLRSSAIGLLLSLTLGCGTASAPAAPPANCPAPAAEPTMAELPLAQAEPAASQSGGQPAIPLDLPRADEFAPHPPLESSAASSYEMVHVIFAVDVDQGGGLFVDGKPVADVGQLTELARLAIAKEPSTRAVIRADRRTSWGSVVHVLDLLKQGGIAKLAFAVSPVPRAP